MNFLSGFSVNSKINRKEKKEQTQIPVILYPEANTNKSLVL